MQPSSAAQVSPQPSPEPGTFARLLADFAAPETKFPPACDLDGLADDIATLSYEQALKTHARYRPPEDTPAQSPAGSSIADTQIRPAAGAPASTSAPSPEQRKTSSVTLRLSPDESEQLRQRAAEAGLTVSAYLRSCAFEVDALRSQVKQALAELRPHKNRSAHQPFWNRLRPWRTRPAARPPG